MNAVYTGKQIVERRKELGLTQKALAEKLHVTDKAVSKWERGLNFPDLGLIESLAEVLDTTPAALLGLEEANQNEIVSAMTEISNERLESAQRDLRWLGWGCIAAAVLLALASSLTGSKVVSRSQTGYQLLSGVLLAAAIGGLFLLFKYGEIRKWNTEDWFVCYGAALPVLIWNGICFFTGCSPNDSLSLCMAAITASMTQLLFYRIMRPQFVKALPAVLTMLFCAWHMWNRTIAAVFITPAVCCLMVYIICRLKKSKE